MMMMMLQARSRMFVVSVERPLASRRTSSHTAANTPASSRSLAASARGRSSARSTYGVTPRRSTPRTRCRVTKTPVADASRPALCPPRRCPSTQDLTIETSSTLTPTGAAELWKIFHSLPAPRPWTMTASIVRSIVARSKLSELITLARSNEDDQLINPFNTNCFKLLLFERFGTKLV